MANILQDIVEAVPNKQPIGKFFKRDAKTVTDAVAKMDEQQIANMEDSFRRNNTHTMSLDGRYNRDNSRGKQEIR